MNEVYTIRLGNGNEYKLQFSTEECGIIAPDILETIQKQGVEVVEIGLGRVKGDAVTSIRVLSKIASSIADMFLSHPNVIISFFCDFINFIPSMNKHKQRMTVQQYRSRLFSCLFERYSAQHNLDNVKNKVVTVEGVAESYYFHIIYRQEHENIAKMIIDGYHNDFDK